MSATFSVSSLLRLTAVALLVVPHSVLAATSLGCVDVSSTFAETYTLTANGPAACQEKCSGYAYYGLAEQFCVCASSKPTIEKTYASSACSFTCPSPYEAYTCGGEDSSTFDFIYNLDYSGSSSSATSSTAAATKTTAASTTPSSTATSTTSSSHSTTTADAVTTPSTVAGTTSSISSSSTGTTTTSSTTTTTSSSSSSSSSSNEASITGEIFQATTTAADGSSTSTVPRTVFVSTLDCSCTDDDVATSTTSTLTVEETAACSEASATTATAATTFSKVLNPGPFTNISSPGVSTVASGMAFSSKGFAASTGVIVATGQSTTVVIAGGSRTMSQGSLLLSVLGSVVAALLM